MVGTRIVWIGALAALLAACNTSPKPDLETWSGGDPARLAADKAQCHAEAGQLDVNDPTTYSDPRYGVTSAMAEAVAKDNPMADRGAIVRRAAYETCMSDKGWKSGQ